MARRIGLAIFAGLLVATALAGCARHSEWEVAVPDRLTLYSIDGRQDGHADKPGPDSGSTFYGYPLLGKITIDDPKRRAALIAAFNRGIARSDGAAAKCFWPRHALRLETGGKVTDYLICFQCFQFLRYQGGPAGGSTIDPSPRPAFDDELKRAGIPLAPSPFGDGK